MLAKWEKGRRKDRGIFWNKRGVLDFKPSPGRGREAEKERYSH